MFWVASSWTGRGRALSPDLGAQPEAQGTAQASIVRSLILGLEHCSLCSAQQDGPATRSAQRVSWLQLPS